jgi:RNA polymerase sigma-70 factor, ECF subfamily
VERASVSPTNGLQPGTGPCDLGAGFDSLRYMDKRSDAALVHAVLHGEVDAFAALATRYRDVYARYAVRMLGSLEDADDVLQAAFIRAFRALARCREPEKFRAWLFQIVINECRSFATQRRRRELRFVRDEGELERSVCAHPSERSGVREEIQRALSAIDPEQREAFVLKHVEELSYEEMTQLTGVGISALKMRVKRACEGLRELLEGVRHD